MLPAIFKGAAQKIRYALDTNNDSDDHYLSTTKTMGSSTKCTFSIWVKLQSSASGHRLVGNGTGGFSTSNYFSIRYGDTNITVANRTSSTTRGHSFTVSSMNNAAWHHIFVQIDTTQGTDTNRVKVWLDNVAQTPASTGSGYFTSSQTVINADTSWQAFHYTTGAGVGTSSDLYVAELCYVDGSILDISRFARSTPAGLKPVRYRGPFGTEGFKLEFENSSNFGVDLAGNGDWTEVESFGSFAQVTDVP